MKKRTIVILALVMGVTFIGLLVMQMRYVEEVLNMRRQHFEESANRALKTVAHDLELEETAQYLLNKPTPTTAVADTATAAAVHSDTLDTYSTTSTISGEYYTKRNAQGSTGAAAKEALRRQYTYEKDLIDEIIYSILHTTGDRPLQDRIDFRRLDQSLKSELTNNDINLGYHFAVYTNNGRCVYRCPDYSDEGSELTFEQPLFRNADVKNMGVLKVHFPEFSRYVYRSITFLTPAIVFTLILLVTFIITIVLVFRQKKLSEMKNDFINNMTHEFKTPISTISLAAQMLNDDTVAKSPTMLKRLSNTISDETKRLRFQVEKVLLLSIYEDQTARLNLTEINANEVIAGVIHTQTLKVTKDGGKIVSNLNAEDPIVMVDEMHFTNVIFNLMNNAIKYRRMDVPLELTVATWNEPRHFCISIKDNGIGIKKENLKKIFEKFYRVHTGNRHDVKGFGLGLAYVKKIINDHKGTVHAESELGIGTTFIIRLPLLNPAN